MSKRAPNNDASRKDHWTGLTAGNALRHELLNKLTPVLLLVDSVGDSDARSIIHSSCLEMVSALEEVIEQYELDKFPASIACSGV